MRLIDADNALELFRAERMRKLGCDIPPHAFCNFGVRKDDLPDDA